MEDFPSEQPSARRNAEELTEAVDTTLGIANPPAREGLPEAEEELRGLRMGREYDREGILMMDTRARRGLRNACARLPLPEFLLDMQAIYQGNGVSREVVAREFKQAMESIDQYSSATSTPRDMIDVVRSTIRAMMRMAAQGGFERESEAEYDNNLLVGKIKQAFNFEVKNREDKNAPFDTEDYRNRILPMLKAMHHAYAACSFNAFSSPANLPGRISNDLESRRALIEHRNTPKRMGSVKDFVAVAQDMIRKQPADRLFSWTKDAAVAERVRKIGERTAALEARWSEHMKGVTFIAPEIIDHRNETVSLWNFDELINTTLDLLEDQLDFIERNAEHIDAKREADVAEGRKKRSENARRENFQKILPDLEVIAQLEHNVTGARAQSETLQTIREKQKGFVASCQTAYHNTWEGMVKVKKPFWRGEKKYLQDMEAIVAKVRHEIRDLKTRSTDIGQLFTDLEDERPYRKESIRFSDFPTEEGDRFFHQQRDIQSKKIALGKERTTLLEGVLQGKEAALQEHKTAADWLKKTENLLLLLDTYHENPSGNAAKYFKENLEEIAAGKEEELTE